MNHVTDLNDRAALNQILSVARSLLTLGSSGLESADSGEPIEREKLTSALEEHIRTQMAVRSRANVTAEVAASEALSKAEAALKRPVNSASDLTDLEIASLEAVIEVTGRPALRYSNGQVQPPSSLLGKNAHWNVLILTSRSKINRASAGVGRIALMNNQGFADAIGTGWRTGVDLIATNRHVAERMASNPSESRKAWKLDAGKNPFLDFAVTDNPASPQRFEIAEIFYVAEEEEIDLAFLKLAPASTTFPAALFVDWKTNAPGEESEGVFQGREIYVVGHPYRQLDSELIENVFGVADGTKRWSPGLIKGISEQTYMLEHDCSTLGGNSGSCVFTADENFVIGIHVGGVDVDETGKGTTNEALALSRIDQHPAATIIRKGKL